MHVESQHFAPRKLKNRTQHLPLGGTERGTEVLWQSKLLWIYALVVSQQRKDGADGEFVEW